MDDELVAVTRNENDGSRAGCGAIWADDQLSIGFLAEVVDDESVRDGVGDVVVDTVASSRSMDLDTLIRTTKSSTKPCPYSEFCRNSE